MCPEKTQLAELRVSSCYLDMAVVIASKRFPDALTLTNFNLHLAFLRA